MRAFLPTALGLLLALPAPAQPAMAQQLSTQQEIAPDDPMLLAAMTDLCLKAALTSGGIDKTTRGYCGCVAPIFARHMTQDSRYRLAVENRLDERPTYDNPDATFDEVVKACPPVK